MFRRNLNTFVGFLDQFGGDITFSVQDNQKVFKTMQGTISSIAIYSLGLLYFFYLFVLYVSNQIPPNLTQVSQFIQGSYSYTFQKPTLAFTIYNSQIKLDPSVVYFSSKIYQYHEGQVLTDNQTIKQTGCEEYLPVGFPSTGCIDQNYNISLDLSKPGKEYYQVVHIWSCQENLLQKGQRCATQAQLNELISQAFFQIIVFLDEYDYKTLSVRRVAKYFYQYLQQDQGYNFRFQISQVDVDSGWFLQQFSSTNLVTDVEQTSFSFNSSLLNSSESKSPPITRFQIVLNPQLNYMTVQYPKVGALLAQFQSVFSVVLILGIVIQAWAERKGNLTIIKGLLQRIFPSASPIQIESLMNGNYLIQCQDNNPLNHFFYQKFIQIKNIEEVLKQLLELRMIVTLLLTPDKVERINRLGMSYEEYLKYLNREKSQNISILNVKQDEEKQKIKIMSRQLNSHKKNESELSIISKSVFDQNGVNLDKIQPMNTQVLIKDRSQNYLNKVLIPQFTFTQINSQQYEINSPSSYYALKDFDLRFEESLE